MQKAAVTALVSALALVACSPSSMDGLADSMSGASGTLARPAISTYECNGSASGTLSQTPSRLSLQANNQTGAVQGYFSINGQTYQMAGSQSMLPGSTDFSLRGMSEGGTVTARMIGASLTGSYRATVNNYRLDMTCR